MTSAYEFEGKTKEEAISKASDALGVSEDQLDVEVLSYGSTGIFGLVGVKKAKIKVTLVDSPEAEIKVALPETPEAEIKEQRPSAEAPEAVAELAKGALEEIISFIVDGATVSVQTKADRIRLKVKGGNSALLIGKHGRTLDALQYIVHRIVHKQQKTRVRVTVDVEGYRDRRKDSLTQLALRLGEKVKRSGKPATISPMNAYDRRIIHVALKDHTGVRTQSSGTGSLRKLVIYPQRKHK
ncbi:MAG: RNA-binding cell elongation regulator Jag/EloR [Deltaproteobacteria bacterium]